MSSSDPMAVLEIAARNELESLLMEFDGTWGPNSLDQYGGRLISHPDKEFRSLGLAELVKIDLHRSWAAGKGRLLEDYLRLFPPLGNTGSVRVDLIAAEYDARRDDGLKVLAEMPSLKTLMLGTSFKERFRPAFVTDDGLVHLQGIANLTELSVVGPLWTDAAAKYVGQLTRLQSLTFGSPTITDEGIEPLAKLQELRYLTLLTPKVSDEAVTRLRGRLPVACRFTDKRDKDKYENES